MRYFLKINFHLSTIKLIHHINFLQGVELDDPHINLLYDSLFYPMKILDGVYWTLIGLGLAIGLIGMVWCMLFAHKPKHLF